MNNISFDFAMRILMSRPDCSLFGLVDGLQYERHFGEEIQREQNVAAPFFSTWPDSRIAFAGPWLFRLNASVHHRERIKQLSVVLPAVSWIISPVSLESLVAHFRPFLNLQLPDGRDAFFRFYDPRVLAETALILDESDYEKLSRGMVAWVFSVNGELRNMKEMDR